MKVGGEDFTYITGSDLERDGMYLELQVEGTAVAEAFYSDVTRQFSVRLFKESVPMEALEWLLSEARARLPSNASAL